MAQQANANASRQGALPSNRVSGSNGPASSAGQAPASNMSTQEQEKAALIMQVLQLSDQQIAMLPPEQRQSIMLLKQQIGSGST